MGIYKSAVLKKRALRGATINYMSNQGRMFPELHAVRRMEKKVEEERRRAEEERRRAEEERRRAEEERRGAEEELKWRARWEAAYNRQSKALNRRGDTALSNDQDQQKRDEFIRMLTGINMKKMRLTDKILSQGDRDRVAALNNMPGYMDEYQANLQTLRSFGFSRDGMPLGLDRLSPRERVAISYMLGTHPDSFDNLGAIEPYSKEYHQAFKGVYDANKKLKMNSLRTDRDQWTPAINAWQSYVNKHGHNNALSAEYAVDHGLVQQWAEHMMAHNRHRFALDPSKGDALDVQQKGYAYINGMAGSLPDLVVPAATLGRYRDAMHLFTGMPTKDAIGRAAAYKGALNEPTYLVDVDQYGRPVYAPLSDTNWAGNMWLGNLGANLMGGIPTMVFGGASALNPKNLFKGFTGKITGAWKGAKGLAKLPWRYIPRTGELINKGWNIVKHPISAAKTGANAIKRVADVGKRSRGVAKALNAKHPNVIAATATAHAIGKSVPADSFVRTSLLTGFGSVLTPEYWHKARNLAYGGRAWNTLTQYSAASNKPLLHFFGDTANTITTVANDTSGSPAYAQNKLDIGGHIKDGFSYLYQVPDMIDNAQYSPQTQRGQIQYPSVFNSGTNSVSSIFTQPPGQIVYHK